MGCASANNKEANTPNEKSTKRFKSSHDETALPGSEAHEIYNDDVDSCSTSIIHHNQEINDIAELASLVIHCELDELFIIKRTLGKGQFGVVYQGILKEQYITEEENREGSEIVNNPSFGIKEIDRTKTSTENIIKEIKILQKLSHPNIVKYLFGMENKEGKIYLIMEQLEGPDLLTHIFANPKEKEGKSALIIREILLTINYLHDVGICHRDIKPENFILTEYGLKMIDFGLSEEIEKDEMKERAMIGTPYYMAPEVIKGRFGKGCDLWSLGVVMFLMLTGRRPFEGRDLQHLFINIMLNPPLYEELEISEIGRSLVKDLLCIEADKRPTASKALEHEWIQKHSPTKVTPLSLSLNAKEDAGGLAYTTFTYTEPMHVLQGSGSQSHQISHNGSEITSNNQICKLRKELYRFIYRIIPSAPNSHLHNHIPLPTWSSSLVYKLLCSHHGLIRTDYLREHLQILGIHISPVEFMSISKYLPGSINMVEFKNIILGYRNWAVPTQ